MACVLSAAAAMLSATPASISCATKRGVADFGDADVLEVSTIKSTALSSVNITVLSPADSVALSQANSIDARVEQLVEDCAIENPAHSYACGWL
ncbi:hypothetical protein T492DRAFT_860646 [Pavlovales sp. CCMP2436]|nr:hypothetical protein T492DRAFT_860646 [Pavlovales sp. CCMP2436]